MTLTMLAFAALVLAVAWALDSHWQRGEIRAECDRLEKRVAELSRQIQKMRLRQLSPVDRPVVRWHDDVEVVGR